MSHGNEKGAQDIDKKDGEIDSTERERETNSQRVDASARVL